MYKKNLIVIFLLYCIKIFAIDTDFHVEKYFVDTILPEPREILYPVYNYNEISFCSPKLLYFFSKHYEKKYLYSIMGLIDFKDSLKLDFNYNKKIYIHKQEFLFDNKTEITNKKIILSKFLYQTDLQSKDFFVLLKPKFYFYPTLLFLRNLSTVELVYKGKFFVRSNYQQFTDLKKSYLGAGFLSVYGNFGIFYSTFFLPSYSFYKKFKNIHININLDAFLNEKDTLGILSEKRTEIYSIFPQRKYFFDLNLNTINLNFHFLAIKNLDELKSYEELKQSPIFYDFGFYLKNEGRNFRYRFKFGNYNNNFSSKNFYCSIFSLNKIRTFYLTNELKYFFYRTLIYDLSVSFNEENSYLTVGIKNLFSKNDPIYSCFSNRTYFFLLSFSDLQFFD